jgi:serine/threonine protein kinase
MPISSRRSRKLFKPGDTFGNFTIVSLLGQGGYGDIYLVRAADSDLTFAMKIESFTAEKRGLEIELLFLESLQDSELFPRLINSGRTDTHQFFVMELLGPSLSNTRRQLPNRRYSAATALRLAVFMFECIREFHRHGFVHRDIKPGNFLLRTGFGNPLVLIDFGLSKRFVDPETGQICPVRANPGFQGTAKYASLNAHYNREQSPRDDLISLLFSIVEMVEGKLPWGGEDERGMCRAKMAIPPRVLFRSLPREIALIAEYVGRLKYASTIKYDYIECLLCQGIYRCGTVADGPFDWEALPESAFQEISAVPSLPRARDCARAMPKLAITDEKERDDERCVFCMVA